MVGLLGARNGRKSPVSGNAFRINAAWWKIWIPAFKMLTSRMEEGSAKFVQEEFIFGFPVYLLSVLYSSCMSLHRCVYAHNYGLNWARLVHGQSYFPGQPCKASLSSFQKLCGPRNRKTTLCTFTCQVPERACQAEKSSQSRGSDWECSESAVPCAGDSSTCS